ncbi:NUDIX hydrolase [Paenibacillus eucommiae]|uniref:8-oxo-dGTP diphosphatase n=1 Tax=Paenibacillus eucommiae TaxID=1355755 RepID=A0ABS4JD57_9BACL|nr:NUDIX domain-containing protein [Paenibacillus eucommiae]MBP1997016.1 8-oxo-dGTP diphosphatase [Paenibacillus eucommiae]
MECTWYGIEEIAADEIKYVVMITEYQNHLVIIRNKKRQLWELPGGKRENDEALIHAASRELYEETGAVNFELTPYGVYLLNESYGMVFFANVSIFDDLPNYEIDEIKLLDRLPDNLLYGGVYYDMYSRWQQQDARSLRSYAIDYKKLTLNKR